MKHSNRKSIQRFFVLLLISTFSLNYLQGSEFATQKEKIRINAVPNTTHLVIPKSYDLNQLEYFGINYPDGNTYWVFEVVHEDLGDNPETDPLLQLRYIHSKINWLVLDSDGKVVEDLETYKNIVLAARAADLICTNSMWQPDELLNKASEIELLLLSSVIMDFLQAIGNAAGSGIVDLLTGGATAVKKMAVKAALKREVRSLLVRAVNIFIDMEINIQDPKVAYKQALRETASEGVLQLTQAAGKNIIINFGDTKDYQNLVDFYNLAKEGFANGQGAINGLYHYYKGGISQYLTDVITTSLGIDDFVDDILNYLGMDTLLKDATEAFAAFHCEIAAEKDGLMIGAEEVQQAFLKAGGLFLDITLDKNTYELREDALLIISVKDENDLPIDVDSVRYSIRNNLGVVKKEGQCSHSGITGKYIDNISISSLGTTENFYLFAIAQLADYKDGEGSIDFNVYKGGNIISDPASLSLRLDRSSVYYGELILTNNGGRQIDVSASKSGGIANWISLSENSFSIPLGGVYTFRFEINVPGSANNSTGEIIFYYETVELHIPIEVSISSTGNNLGVGSIDGAFHPDTPSQYNGDVILLKYPNVLITDENISTARHSDSFDMSTDKVSRLIRLENYSRVSKEYEYSGPNSHYLAFDINSKNVWLLHKDIIEEWEDVLTKAQPGTNNFLFRLNNCTYGAGRIRYKVENYWFEAIYSQNAWWKIHTVDQNLLDKWITGWDTGHLRARISSLGKTGYLYLFINGEFAYRTYVSGYTDKVSFYLDRKDAENLKTQNAFNIKGCYFSSSNTDWDNHTKVDLEDIILDIKYYTGEPNLTISKTVEDSELLTNESTKVKIEITNVGTNKAYSVRFMDSLPGGLQLESGSLDGSTSLRPSEKAVYCYYIKALQKGGYTLPELEVSYKNPSDDKKYAYSNNKPSLNVEEPITFSLTANLDKIEYVEGENVLLDLNLESNINESMENVFVYTTLLNDDIVIHSSSGNFDVDGKFSDTFIAPFLPKVYILRIKIAYQDHIYLEDNIDLKVIDTTPPDKPIIIAPTNTSVISGSSPNFDWLDCSEEGSGLDKYILEVDDNIDFSNFEIYKETQNSNYDAEELLNDGVYYFKVKATDQVGNWSESETYSFEIDTTPPGNVTGFEAIPSGSFIKLNWNNPTDPDLCGIRVIRSKVDFPINIDDGKEVYNGTDASFQDYDVNLGIKYFYSAFAYDGAPNFTEPVSSAQDDATLEPLGFLSVTISPNEAINAGAKWRLDSESIWHNSNETVEYPPGKDYTLEFKEISGWRKPDDKQVQIFSNTKTYESGDYIKIEFITDKNTVNVLEGGEEIFQVKLSAQPTSDVNVTVSRVSGDADITIKSGANLTFTSVNWDTFQTVILEAAQDGDAENGEAIFKISAANIDDKDITATEGDDETQGFITDKDTVTVPEGGEASFQVRLSTQPTSDINVTVGKVSGDPDITIKSGASLTFNSTNWDTYQTVTLEAAQDSDAMNGEAIFRISATSINDKDITVKEEDDEFNNGNVNVPASAFTGRNSAVAYSRSDSSEYIFIMSGDSGHLIAPVILPDGAIIKYVRLNFIDNTDSGFIQVHLVRLNHFNGISANVFSVTTENSASSPSMQWVVDNTASPTSAYRKVRNGQVTWNISAYLSSSSSDLRIYSVQIEYMY